MIEGGVIAAVAITFGGLVNRPEVSGQLLAILGPRDEA